MFCWIYFYAAMDWDNFKVFLAVARTRSIAGAARELRMDQSTVSRRLHRLEHELDSQLFSGEGAQKVLTPFGLKTLEHAERVEASIYDTLADAKSAKEVPNGTATISASSSIIRHALIPRIEDLSAKHKNVRVQFDVSHEIADLSRMDADLAIRLQEPKAGDYAQQKIGKLAFSVYQSAHVERVEDWIGFRGRLAAIAEVQEIENALPQRPALIRTNDPGMSLDAVRTGLVVGVLPSFVAACFDDLKPIKNAPSVQRDVWLVTRMDMKDLPHIVAAKAWVRSCMSEIHDQNRC